MSIAQAIRKSLAGHAKSVLQAMGPKAKPLEMVNRLESTFGQVASGEAVLQEFYTADQRSDESLVDWGTQTCAYTTNINKIMFQWGLKK